MIYAIHKISVLIKNQLNYLKDNIFECFFKKYNRFSFFFKFSFDEDIIIKDIRNLFRLKKEQNYTAVKDVRNLFRQEKETKVIKGYLRYKMITPQSVLSEAHVKNLFIS